MASQVSQNFHTDCEAAINNMVTLKLSVSYVYLSMSHYFARDDVALGCFSEFLREQSEEAQVQAEEFLSYQTQRGGRILLKDIQKPEQDEWGTGLEALQSALKLEKMLNQGLLDLHTLAKDKDDPHLCDFLRSYPLKQQVTTIKQLGDYITNLQRLGGPQSGLGEYLFDKLSLGEGRAAKLAPGVSGPRLE
ncbi:ferritin heavy chain A-like [Tachyglossus aculeatus]|uniref:ferritin heavy chain A-like n=1 Tax=Tachyglossus aculeatus TaxID=9261 RepID=UPI0018F3CC8C|nr:ferritin heavy chain A-like [Tachyglossus aculeatus]